MEMIRVKVRDRYGVRVKVRVRVMVRVRERDGVECIYISRGVNMIRVIKVNVKIRVKQRIHTIGVHSIRMVRCGARSAE